MLTIKHVNGEFESLVEAERLIVEPRSDGFHQITAFDQTADDYKVSWCCAGLRNGAHLGEQVIYVMNRNGATVATYSFSEPEFEPLETQLAA